MSASRLVYEKNPNSSLQQLQGKNSSTITHPLKNEKKIFSIRNKQRWPFHLRIISQKKKFSTVITVNDVSSRLIKFFRRITCFSGPVTVTQFELTGNGICIHIFSLVFKYTTSYSVSWELRNVISVLQIVVCEFPCCQCVLMYQFIKFFLVAVALGEFKIFRCFCHVGRYYSYGVYQIKRDRDTE